MFQSERFCQAFDCMWRQPTRQKGRSCTVGHAVLHFACSSSVYAYKASIVIVIDRSKTGRGLKYPCARKKHVYCLNLRRPKMSIILNRLVTPRDRSIRYTNSFSHEPIIGPREPHPCVRTPVLIVERSEARKPEPIGHCCNCRS